VSKDKTRINSGTSNLVLILRSDALRNDEQPVRIIPVLDAFKSRIVRAKKGLLPIDLEQGRLLSEVNKYTRLESDARDEPR
jgi:hypothetical protein